MNFHNRRFYLNNINDYDRWTKFDDAAMLKMHREGVTNKRIGMKLRRSENAVGSRLRKNFKASFPKLPKSIPHRAEETVMVSKFALPDWYTLGWRVVGFAGDEVRIEWPHKAPSRIPGEA